MVVLLVSRPLVSPHLWWDLARGREVLRGTFHPARELLVLDDASEATWLGGVPFFGLWSIGGVWALAVVPVLAGGILWALLAKWHRHSTGLLTASATLVLLLFSVRADLEPTIWLWDLAGLLATWSVLKFVDRRRLSVTLLVSVFACWANLGPRPIWGLLLVLLWPERSTERGSALGWCILAGMLTPRGPLTWLDSMVLFAPSAFVPDVILEAQWRSVLDSGWHPGLVAGGLLWLATLFRMTRQQSMRAARGLSIALLSAPVFAVMLSTSNLAPAALWTVLIGIPESRSALAANRGCPQSGWHWAAIVLLSMFCVADALGLPGARSGRLGWGISQAIDPRLLEIGDMIAGDKVIAWTGDCRSAGIAAWANTNSKLVDHPVRAILGGRAPLHAGIHRDLLWAHRAAYRLDDGNWGGWGRPFGAWQVEMLFLPDEADPLHRALLGTAWKPVKLDSPTVPYVSAERSRFDRAVVEVVLQQSFVETGAWQPTSEVYDSQGWRLDVWERLGLGPDVSPAIRLSRFFRAIQLPIAAVRALEPYRQTGVSSIEQEFLACQAALAFDEWITLGQVSLLRQAVLEAGGMELSVAGPWKTTSFNPDALSPEWRAAVKEYCGGQTRTAAESLTGTSPEVQFARGMLWLECGEPSRAITEFEAAIQAGTSKVSIAAKYWLTQLSPRQPQTGAPAKPSIERPLMTRTASPGQTGEEM